ncbi:hypothetical protein BDV26DRAFT_53630 [Aspergillus bertholletiae]|uniref:Paired amphipathic helix n=1 Tax=Aspergillus bertholletiae TaxID=1226010 RepID=A0A5N7AW98_9EURO|nr:hypothetical protein BDV26DRAFT_53630 [Aspergillus bertholletiae]
MVSRRAFSWGQLLLILHALCGISVALERPPLHKGVASRNLTVESGNHTPRSLPHEKSGLLSPTIDSVNTRSEFERSRPAIDASQPVDLPSFVEASNWTTSTTRQPNTKEGVSPGRIAPTAMSSSGRSSQKGSGKDDCVGLGDAVSFINTIKDRFAEQPEVFTEFMLILQAYQRESLPLRKVYEQVEDLFDSEPDLMKDFKRFLPETTAYKQ